LDEHIDRDQRTLGSQLGEDVGRYVVVSSVSLKLGRFGRCGLAMPTSSPPNTVEEVAAASVVEVAVKEPKKVSTGLARMSTMPAGKTTPDRTTMLHIEFPISPTWHSNC
jgi:hypothetical protein